MKPDVASLRRHYPVQVQRVHLSLAAPLTRNDINYWEERSNMDRIAGNSPLKRPVERHVASGSVGLVADLGGSVVSLTVFVIQADRGRPKPDIGLTHLPLRCGPAEKTFTAIAKSRERRTGTVRTLPPFTLVNLMSATSI